MKSQIKYTILLSTIIMATSVNAESNLQQPSILKGLATNTVENLSIKEISDTRGQFLYCPNYSSCSVHQLTTADANNVFNNWSYFNTGGRIYYYGVNFNNGLHVSR